MLNFLFAVPLSRSFGRAPYIFQIRLRIPFSRFRETNRKGQERYTENDDSKTEQGIRPGHSPFEKEARGDRTHIAARPDDAGHRPQGTFVDKRHHGESGALRHLHKETEAQQGRDRRRQEIHSRKGDQKYPLHKQRHK